MFGIQLSPFASSHDLPTPKLNLRNEILGRQSPLQSSCSMFWRSLDNCLYLQVFPGLPYQKFIPEIVLVNGNVTSLIFLGWPYYYLLWRCEVLLPFGLSVMADDRIQGSDVTNVSSDPSMVMDFILKYFILSPIIQGWYSCFISLWVGHGFDLWS